MGRARPLAAGESLAACLGAVLRRLRELRHLSQDELGRLAGYDGSYVGAVERASLRPSRQLVAALDRALDAAGGLLALWRLADQEWAVRASSGPASTTGAAPAPPPAEPAAAAGGAAAPAGTPPDAVVEAMELARRVEACDVGPATVNGIERAVERLARAASGTPPEALIRAVRAQRGYVGRLLGGRLTLGRRRRLLVAAGRLSLELARLHFEAGQRAAAESNRDAALRLARQAGDSELAACAVEALAAWALADGRFRDALELARAGQDLAPPAGLAALRLALDEAEAWTSLGDHRAAAGARRQAALTRAMLPGAGLPVPGTAPAAAAAS